MGQTKLSRYVGTFLFASAITCMIGFWWARTSGSETWLFWAKGAKWTLIALVICAGYMAAVGLYHTALAALGLDGQPGIFSSGGRSGPLSGPPPGYSQGPAESPGKSAGKLDS
jgi:hypothetical protein